MEVDAQRGIYRVDLGLCVVFSTWLLAIRRLQEASLRGLRPAVMGGQRASLVILLGEERYKSGEGFTNKLEGPPVSCDLPGFVRHGDWCWWVLRNVEIMGRFMMLRWVESIDMVCHYYAWPKWSLCAWVLVAPKPPLPLGLRGCTEDLQSQHGALLPQVFISPTARSAGVVRGLAIVTVKKDPVTFLICFGVLFAHCEFHV